MRWSLFAAMRGADGRSLGRALIVLLLLNLVSGGLVSATQALPGDGQPICGTSGTAYPAHAPGALHSDCCIAGCAAACCAAADARPPSLLGFIVATWTPAPVSSLLSEPVPTALLLQPLGPRGPPGSA